jgi:hypothetical protein
LRLYRRCGRFSGEFHLVNRTQRLVQLGIGHGVQVPCGGGALCLYSGLERLGAGRGVVGARLVVLMKAVMHLNVRRGRIAESGASGLFHLGVPVLSLLHIGRAQVLLDVRGPSL